MDKLINRLDSILARIDKLRADKKGWIRHANTIIKLNHEVRSIRRQMREVQA